MPFSTAEDYRHFASAVKHERRFMLDEKTTLFLKEVAETALSRVAEIKSGSVLWRAQLGSQPYTFNKGEEDEEERPAPWFEDRMVPKPIYVGEGRANPRGVAYLYLASNYTTAGSEVRPWLGASISISQFTLNRNVRLVNCTEDKKRWLKAFNLETGPVPWAPEEYESVVWGDIGDAMSRPYSIEEQSLNYVPTQVIAERLRAAGFDGMVYKSLLSEDGFNIVLFNVADATPRNFQLYEVTSLAYKFETADNMFFPSKPTHAPAT